MPSVEVLFSGQPMSTYNLDKDVHIIGRQEDCDIHIDNLGISRHHARFVRDGEGYAVEDMNSSNGTFVNGERVSRQLLSDGAEVVIGKYLIRYSSEDASSNSYKETTNIAAPGFPGGDALNTMAMDGDAMRKKLQEMHASATRHEAPAPHQVEAPTPASMSSAKTSAEAEAELRARQLENEMLQRNMQMMRMVLGILVLLLVVGGAVAAIMMSRGG